jgi:hypothetical protein
MKSLWTQSFEFPRFHGGGYSAEAQQFFDRISDPGTTRKNLYAACIDSIVSAGVWAKLDALYIFAANSQSNALTNIKQSSYGATAVNSPTFVTDRYFQGDGSTAYLDSNFNPTTASSPNFTQNSACNFGWVLNNATNANRVLGAVSGTANRLVPRSTTNNAQWEINQTTANTVSNSDSSGLFLLNRSGSAAARLYRNGSELQTSTAASTAPANSNFTAFRNASAYNGTHQLAVWGFGASLDATEQSDLYNALLAYLQGVGAV